MIKKPPYDEISLPPVVCDKIRESEKLKAKTYCMIAP
jgi:hypothetical protein